MASILNAARRLVLILAGIAICLALTAPILMLGIFYGSLLLLIHVIVNVCNTWITRKNLCLTEQDKECLELAFLLSFSGPILGMKYVKEHWTI